MNENEKGIEIDLKRLFKILFRKTWLLLLIGALTGILAFIYSIFFMKPMYAASTKLYVNNTYSTATEGYSSSQIQAAQDLANTYMVIVESRPVLDKIRQTTGFNYTDENLSEMITSAAINKTEIFQVEVTCSDSSHAIAITNAIATILPGHVGEVVPGSSVTVVERASEVPNKVSPSKTQNTIIGFLIGFVVCGAVIVVVELTNESINTEEYLARTYPDIPLLAVIPDIEASGSYGRYYKGHYATERSKTPVPPTVTGGDR